MNNMLLKPFYLPIEMYLHDRTFDYNVHDKPVLIWYAARKSSFHVVPISAGIFLSAAYETIRVLSPIPIKYS